MLVSTTVPYDAPGIAQIPGFAIPNPQSERPNAEAISVDQPEPPNDTDKSCP